MNCRDFIIEFEDRCGNLTETATLHVKVCADCQKTSREQTRMWQMIDELRRIDAPKDFDFRVKARIAQGSPADFQPRFFPALRYVLPLGLIVLILGAVAFNTTYFSGGDAPQIVKTAASQTPVAAENPANSFPMPEQIAANENAPQSAPDKNITAENLNIKPAAKQRENQFVADKSTGKLLTELPKANPKNNSGGGSVDKTFSSPKILTPENLNPNKKVEPLPNAGNQNSITDAQILSFIGIETVAENGGKKVKSVKTDSLAARSDVRVGDVVEAIDGKRIGGEPTRMETFESKKLTVVRDAKRIEIVLQDKSN